MKTSSCKQKGRRLQKLVVKKLLEAFPTLTERDVKSTSMGASGVDIQLSTAAYCKAPFSIEAKNQEVNKTFLNMWNQATDNSNLQDALLILSANNSPVLAVMTLDYLMNILTGKAFVTGPNK